MMMSRLTLIALQILVAVVGIAIWHILTSVPIAGVIVLPPFFFSTPFDVVARIWLKPGARLRRRKSSLNVSNCASVLPYSIVTGKNPTRSSDIRCMLLR